VNLSAISALVVEYLKKYFVILNFNFKITGITENMIKRDIQNILPDLTATYPVVTITGPRQAGKTTLARMAYADYNYCNLEDPDIRMLAATDHKSFFRQYPPPVIIDEIQRVPELTSYIQVMTDDSHKNGQFILTGSQNLSLSQSISQSLAGRTALITLLPFSVNELKQYKNISLQRDLLIHNGFLPRIYDQNQQPVIAYRNYLQTYVERDLRQLINIKDLMVFEKFLRLLAGRIGQLLNMSSLASDTGVSVTTITNWISILEASYIIFRLEPYYRNISKRLIKSPKIYFIETGFAAYLLGIENEKQVGRDPLLGSLFENMAVTELLKARFNMGLGSNLFFFRDSQHNEVDVLLKQGNDFIPVEIKAAESYHPDFAKNINKFRQITGTDNQGYIIYGGSHYFNTSENIQLYGIENINAIVKNEF